MEVAGLRHLASVGMFIVWSSALSSAEPVGTAFTYQGQLKEAGSPANGTYDFKFTLHDDPESGLQVGDLVEILNQEVTDGLFTVLLDFGNMFDGTALWLWVQVRESGAGSYTPLWPRQPLTPAPYAVYALNSPGGAGVTSITAGDGLTGDSTTGDVTLHVGAGDGINVSDDTVQVAIPLTLTGSQSGGPVIQGSNSSDTDSSSAVMGTTSASNGWTYGVYGQSGGWGGSGVYGRTTHSSGSTRGVWGVSESTSTDSHGVAGWAIASSGFTEGVYGVSDSTSGTGILGYASASSGNTKGVHGITNSSSGYGVFSVGDYGGTGAKDFIQPHPTDASKEIRFVSLEGNESGTYFRGSSHLVSGRAVIDVPEEFRLVTESEGLTVQLTAIGAKGGLWIESKALDRIVVRGEGNVEFDYLVNGIRRGFADIELIRENYAYAPETRGVPYGTQYPDALRQILVENDILNPDYTPNEQTAARLGWTLRNPDPYDSLDDDSEAKRSADQATTDHVAHLELAREGGAQ